MASIFKPKYPVRETKIHPVSGKKIRVPVLDKRGKPLYRESAKWAIKYTDASGKQRVIGGYTDKMATEQKAATIEKRTARQSEGVFDVDPKHAGTPIANHVKDWLADLERSGRSTEYTRKVKARVNAMIADRKWVRLASIRTDEVTTWATAKRQGGMGEQTTNHYVDALRAFCQWCVTQKRMEQNPILSVLRSDVVEPVCKRRAATLDELRRLVDVHPYRGKVYLTAALTGLRRQELQLLEWQDVVNLDSESAYLKLRAHTTKSRRSDEISIPPELVEMLREHRPAACLPTARVFRSIPKSSTVKADVKAAGIAIDDHKGKIDFHAMRKTYCTILARNNVPIRDAKELMRHTDIRLTSEIYTDANLIRHDAAGAVRNLPRVAATAPREQRATGTDGELAYTEAYTKNVPKLGKTVRHPNDNQPKMLETGNSENAEKQGENSDFQGDKTKSQNWRRGESNPREDSIKADPTSTYSTPNRGIYQTGKRLGDCLGNDPELARVVAAWAELPQAIRAGIVAMVNAATPNRDAKK